MPRRVKGFGGQQYKLHEGPANIVTLAADTAQVNINPNTDTLVLDPDGGDIDQPLPPAASNVGRSLTMVSVGGNGNSVVVAPLGGDTLTPADPAVIGDGGSKTFQAISATQWQVISTV